MVGGGPSRSPTCCCCCFSLCCGGCSNNRLTPRGNDAAGFPWAPHAKAGVDDKMQPPGMIAMANTFDEKRRIATKDAGDMSRPPATLLEAAARKVLQNLASLAAATDYDLFMSGGGLLSRRNSEGVESGRKGRMLVPTAPKKFAECWVRAVHEADTKWMFKREVTDMLSKDITYKAIDLMTYVNRPAVQKKLNKAVQAIVDEVQKHSSSGKTAGGDASSATNRAKTSTAAAAASSDVTAGCNPDEAANNAEGYLVQSGDDDVAEECEDEEGSDASEENTGDSKQLNAQQMRFLRRLKIHLDGPRPVNERDCHKKDKDGNPVANQEWIMKYTVYKGIFRASMEDEFTVVGGKITKLIRRKV